MFEKAAGKGFLVLALLSFLSTQVSAQTPPDWALTFSRNDNITYRADHGVAFRATDANATGLVVDIDSRLDFEAITLSVTTNTKLRNTEVYYIKNFDIDWDEDPNGVFETHIQAPACDPDGHDSKTCHQVLVSHTYPPPPNGYASATHHVNFQVPIYDVHGALAFTRTGGFDVTIYARPPVFVNTNGDVIVQTRNENASAKTAVLLVEGIDVLNNTYPNNVYERTEGMVNGEFVPRGLETFIVNFHNGGDDLRTNAAVVTKALETVQALCPTNNVVLIAFSMGGVVSRYAMAKQEAMGNDHHVGLFISYDSPQQIAHANHQLQDLVKSISVPVGANDILEYLQAVFKSQASKQLLEYDAYDPGAPTGPSPTQHDAFYNELRALTPDGYPHLCYNASVSDGALTPAYVGPNDATPGHHDFYQQPLLNITVHKKDETLGSLHADLEYRDIGPASVFPNFAMYKYGDFLHSGVAAAALDAQGYWYDVVAARDPGFIPTVSSLDLVNPQMYDQASAITGWDSSHFDAFTYQSTSLEHVAASPSAIASVLSWLDRTTTLRVNYEVLGGGVAIDSDILPIPVTHGTVAIPNKTIVWNGVSMTYEFAAWSDGNTDNPRTFVSLRPTVRSVYMKRRFVASESGEGWSSNQRRVAQAYLDTGYPNYTVATSDHMVYASDGAIWYHRRANNEAWSTVRLLSGVSVGAMSPCVATDAYALSYWGSHIAAAWIEPGGKVMYRTSWSGGPPGYIGNDGATWQPIRQLQVSVDPTSVVLPDMSSIVWAEGAGCVGCSGLYYYPSPNDNPTWTHYLIPGTSGNVSQPVCTGGDLAFIRDGHVWAMSFYPGSPPTQASAPVDLTADLPAGWTARNPSSAGGAYLAWEESNGTASRIAYRQRVSGVWSATSYFTHVTHAVSKPSLSIDNGCATSTSPVLPAKLKLVWQCGGHIALVTRSINGSSWTPVMDLGNGGAPSMAASTFIRPLAMWPSGGASPYAINLSNSLPCDENIAPEQITSLALDEVSGTTMLISWTAPGDDGNVGTATSYDIRYRTAPITDDNVFGMSTPWMSPPTPQPAGSFQQCQITGLQTCTHYYFAIKAIDDVGNKSLMSYTTGTHTLCNGGGGYGEGRIALGSARVGAVAGEADSALSINWIPTGSGGTLRAARVPVDGEVGAKLTDSGGTFLVLDANSGADGRHWREMGGDVGIRLVGGAARSYLVPLSSQLTGIASSTSILNRGSGTALSASSASYGSTGDVLSLLSGGWVPDFASGDALEVAYGGNPGLSEDGEDWIVRLNVPLADRGEQPKIGAATRNTEPASVAEREMLSSNPSRGPVAFAVTLHQPTNGAVSVLDVAGRLVRETSIGVLGAGRHVIRWDGKDENGTQVRSGVYFVYLKGSDLAPKRVVIAR